MRFRQSIVLIVAAALLSSVVALAAASSFADVADDNIFAANRTVPRYHSSDHHDRGR